MGSGTTALEITDTQDTARFSQKITNQKLLLFGIAISYSALIYLVFNSLHNMWMTPFFALYIMGIQGVLKVDINLYGPFSEKQGSQLRVQRKEPSGVCGRVFQAYSIQGVANLYYISPSRQQRNIVTAMYYLRRVWTGVPGVVRLTTGATRWSEGGTIVHPGRRRVDLGSFLCKLSCRKSDETF